MESIEKRAVRCLRLLLEGKVSWDHVIEEFGTQETGVVREAVELVEDISANRDRYSKAKEIEPALKNRIEFLIEKLERKDQRE